MRFIVFTHTTFIAFALFAVRSQAEVTVQERASFWAAMQIQYAADPQTIYDDGVTEPPAYPVFLVPNEDAYLSLALTKSAGSLQVGFGSTIHFSLAAALRPKVIIIADESLEAQAMVSSFYRPLFMASETPEQFVAHLGGVDIHRRENTQSILDRLIIGEFPTVRAVEELKEKLAQLESQGLVTALDIRFVDYVLREQGRPFPSTLPLSGSQAQVSIFRNAHEVSTIAHRFAEQASCQLAEKCGGFSFLTPEGFAAVRKLFLGNRVFYAKGAAENPELWKAIADFSRRAHKKISGVYLANPVDATGPSGDKVMMAARQGLGRRSPNKLNIYFAPPVRPCFQSVAQMGFRP